MPTLDGSVEPSRSALEPARIAAAPAAGACGRSRPHMVGAKDGTIASMSFRCRAYLFALSVVAACGGKVTDDSTGTTGGPGGASGMLAGGAGSAGSAQTPSGSGGSAGTLAPGAPTCEQVCDRFAQAGCTIKDCATNCNRELIQAGSCGAESDAALQCAAQAPFECQPRGQGAKIPACDRENDLLLECITRTTPPPAAPVPTTPTAPSNCLGVAPVPPSGMVCTGGGASGGGTTTGTGGAAASCQNECRDRAGNAWSSYCVGSSCSCIYNGNTYCTCTSASPCSSCCPGI
jgi:hypothetical protein